MDQLQGGLTAQQAGKREEGRVRRRYRDVFLLISAGKGLGSGCEFLAHAVKMAGAISSFSA